MVNATVIAKRELGAYFLSPIAYVVLTGFALAHGILFAASMTSPIDPGAMAQGAMQATLALMLCAMPLLTMRLLSEETARGTIETLMTAPVTEIEVVTGKFVAALIFVVAMQVPVVAEVVFLRSMGPMDLGPLLAGFLGMVLLAAQFTAVGMLISALTRIQVASAIITFVVLLGLFIIQFVVGDGTSVLAQALRYMSPPTHFTSFPKGIVDTRDLAYFVFTTGAFLFLTVNALSLRRWR